jgi:hypothetical protein
MTTTRKTKTVAPTWEQVCERAGVHTGTMTSLEMVQMLCDHNGHPTSLPEISAAYGRWVWSRD